MNSRHSRPAAPAIRAQNALPDHVDFAKTIHHNISPELNYSNSIATSHKAIFGRVLQTPEAREHFRTGGEWTKDAIGSVGVWGEIVEKAGQGRHAIQALDRHAVAAAQLGRDVARIKAEFHIAAKAAEAGSPAARSALSFMKPMLVQGQALLERERSLQHGYGRIAAEYGALSASKAGRLALATEKLLKTSRIGRTVLATGKIASDEGLGRLLAGVGAASAAWKVYETSAAQSRAGRLAHAGAAAFTGFVADVGVARANPIAALYDPAVKYGFQAAGHKELGEALTISKWAEGTADVLSALGRGICSGDSEPLSGVHRRNMSGANGKVIQGYAMIGEEVANLMDPVYTKVADLSARIPAAVSKSFKNSQAWWAGHH